MSFNNNNLKEKCQILLKYDYDKRIQELQDDNRKAVQRNKELKETVSKLYNYNSVDQIATATKLATAKRVFKQQLNQSNLQWLQQIEQNVKRKELNQNLAYSNLQRVKNSLLNLQNTYKNNLEPECTNAQQCTRNQQHIMSSNENQKTECPPKNSDLDNVEKKSYISKCHEPVYMVQNSSSGRSNNNQPVYMKQNVKHSNDFFETRIEQNSREISKEDKKLKGDVKTQKVDEPEASIAHSSPNKSENEKQIMQDALSRSEQDDVSDVAQSELQICDSDSNTEIALVDSNDGRGIQINNNIINNEVSNDNNITCKNKKSNEKIYSESEEHNYDGIIRVDDEDFDDSNSNKNKHQSSTSILNKNQLQIEIGSNDIQDTIEQKFYSDQKTNKKGENSSENNDSIALDLKESQQDYMEDKNSQKEQNGVEVQKQVQDVRIHQDNEQVEESKSEELKMGDMKVGKQQNDDPPASPLFTLASNSSSPARKIRQAAFDDDDFDF